MSRPDPSGTDESATVAAIPALYERHAAEFARRRGDGPWPELVWLHRFAAQLARPATILDLGCGIGIPVARYFAERGHAVTGIDTASRMIDRAHANVPAAKFEVGDMRAFDPGRAFGGVIAWDSFFHLSHDDQRAMIPRFAGHAAPAAPLLFNTGPRHGIAMGEFGGEPLFHASLAPEEYRALLDTNGFSVLEFAPEDRDAGGRTVWLARKR